MQELKDPAWIDWVEAASQDTEARLIASQVLMAHFSSTGDRDQVQRVAQSLEAMYNDDSRASANLGSLTGFWQYRTCPWPEEDKLALAGWLATIKKVHRAYLVERFTHDPRHDNVCLVVQYGSGLVLPDTMLQKVSKHELTNRCSVFIVKKPTDEIATVPGGLIYERGK